MKLGDEVKISWNGRLGKIVAIHGSVYPFHWMVELDSRKRLLFRGDELEVLEGGSHVGNLSTINEM